MAKPNVNDLLFGVDWISSYDGGEDDPNTESAKRLIAFFHAEIVRRRLEKAEPDLARIAKERNIPLRTIRGRARTKMFEELRKRNPNEDGP